MREDRDRKMRSIRHDFSSRSDVYDQEIIRSVPNYLPMLEAAVSSLPFEENAPLRIIDLGTGTGALAERVLDRFPNCHLTLVDMTENMLDKARERLGESGATTFLVKDFYDLQLPKDIDAVVSSLALHHLITGEDKRSF